MGRVTLFGGIVGPMGDAYDNPRRPNSYNRTMHGLASEAGFMPFVQGTQVDFYATASNFPWEFRSVVEWETSAGVPFLLVAGGAITPITVLIPSTGVAVSETNGFAASSRIDPTFAHICAALHSDGSTVPYYFVGVGAAEAARYRTAGGTWAAMAGTPSALAGFYSENGNLWGILPNGYQVRKWPAGINPVSGTAGAAIDVGISTQKITGCGLLGRSYQVFVKPDGIYVYDIDTNRFENIWTGLRSNLHPDTGKGTYTWGADVYVPLGWGGAVRVTPSLDIIPIGPLTPDCRPDQTTPGASRITAFAGDASHLYAVIQPFDRVLGLAGAGLAVHDLTNSRTSVATDDDLGTTFTTGTGGTPPIFTIYVGCDVRHGGFTIDIDQSSVVLVSTAHIAVLEYYNGSTWVGVDFHDYSRLMRSGAIVPDARISSDWAQVAVNSITKYWLRLSHTTNTIITANAIREVAPLPGTNTAQTGRDEAHLTTHILRGYPAPGGFFWEDVISYDGDCSLALILTRLKAAYGRSLIAIGPISYVRFPLGARTNPDQQLYADCTNGFASTWYFSAKTLLDDRSDAPMLRKRVTAIEMMVRDFSDGADIAQAWVRFDKGTWTQIDTTRTSQGAGLIRLEAPLHDNAQGYLYEVAVGIEDTAQGETVPKITHVSALVEGMAEQGKP